MGMIRRFSEEERRDAHPVYAAFMRHQDSQSFSRDEVRETVIPTYMGLVKQIDDHLGRLFRHMDAKGAKRVTPRLREKEDAGMQIGDWIKPDNFNPNYLMRSIHLMPKAGDKPEWMHDQDYWSEKDILPAADLDDGCLVYE